MAERPTGLPKPKSYFFLSTSVAGPVPPSSESRHPMATSSWDWRGNSTLLKNVRPTMFAISTRLEVAPMEILTGPLIGVLSQMSAQAYLTRAQAKFLPPVRGRDFLPKPPACQDRMGVFRFDSTRRSAYDPLNMAQTFFKVLAP